MKRVLLDNCVDHLSRERLQNGQLVRTAALQFDALITVDKNMRHQTHLAGVDLAVIVLDVEKNRLDRILPLLTSLIETLATAVPGEYHIVRRD